MNGSKRSQAKDRATKPSSTNDVPYPSNTTDLPQPTFPLVAEAIMDTHAGTLIKIDLQPSHGRGTTPVRWNHRLFAQVCALANMFDDQPDDRVRLSLAVHLEQITDPAFYKTLEEALAAAHVDPQMLELSLAEPELDERAYAASDFRELRAMGVHLALREFGAGPAPLRLFEKHDLSSVSLAPSLVGRLRQPLRGSHYAAAVVSCLVELSQLLDFEVVACGVSGSEQAHLLRGLGCKLQQGPYYAPPVVLNNANVKQTLEQSWLGLT